MGIDYYLCNHCGRSFPDVGCYESCDCGEYWCSSECAKKDKLRKNKNGETSCKYCREEDFSDDELLKFALKLLGKTRKQIITEYKGNK